MHKEATINTQSLAEVLTVQLISMRYSLLFQQNPAIVMSTYQYMQVFDIKIAYI